MKTAMIFLTAILLSSCGDEKRTNGFPPEEPNTSQNNKQDSLSQDNNATTDSSNNKKKSAASKRDVHVGFSNNGIATIQLVDRILNKYDQDGDGILSVSEDSFLRTDLGRDSVLKKSFIRVESRGVLFSEADKLGNRDGKVTELELYDYISKFDVDGDGEITTGNSIFDSLFGGDSEWEKFEEKHEERIKYTSKN